MFEVRSTSIPSGEDLPGALSYQLDRLHGVTAFPPLFWVWVKRATPYRIIVLANCTVGKMGPSNIPFLTPDIEKRRCVRSKIPLLDTVVAPHIIAI